MLPRVVALFLAIVMLWSGLAITEQRFAQALGLPEFAASLSTDAKRGDLNGSMDDHLGDDQPSQAFSEPALDVAILIDTERATPRCTSRMPCPSQAEATLQAPPYLEGLHRPPRVA